ncbi:MAG: hypothetical protein LBE76_05940 [Nitrososphaerota archaeon]|nr:hypothetical protein [Nitrososphaerota archaeon]
MKKSVELGKTLLVNGSASVKVLSGKAEVFGYVIGEGQHIVVREGKRQPFFVLENTEFQVLLGLNGSVQEVETSTIPVSWDDALQMVRAIEKKDKPVVVMVVGKVDVGKSSFSTYLVNRLVNGKSMIVVLDSDLGQSEIGPPCTVAYGYSVKRVTEICELNTGNAFFVGATSPVDVVNRAIEGSVEMFKEIMQKVGVGYVIVNTDGWVDGEEAINHKLQLVRQLKPDLVIGMGNQENLGPLFLGLSSVSTCCIEPSASVNERVSEKRTKLRELNYMKYLKGAKVRSFVSSYMTILERGCLPKEAGREKGILVGLQDVKGGFLGIGILLEFNRVKRFMKVLTSVSCKPAGIVIGRMRLDPELKELTL